MNKGKRHIFLLIIVCIVYPAIGITLESVLNVDEPWIYASIFFMLGAIYQTFSIGE